MELCSNPVNTAAAAAASVVNDNKQTLVLVVQRCLDENNDGFIERQRFLDFCGDLSVSTDELQHVFDALDGDGDGKINVSDFTNSFDQITEMLGKQSTENLAVCSAQDRSMYECHVNGLESPMQSIIAGQQYISELYYNLTNSNQPDLVDLFEKHLASVVKDIKSRASENQRLEEALKRATKQHARQVNNLDREMESQMEKLEAKVREEEKLLFDKKLSDLQWQLDNKDNEMSTMTKTIDTLHERLNKETSKPSRKDEIDNICQENRLLKSQVTDSQTALALLRSELAELRSECVEQSELLQKAQRRSEDSLAEQENLSRQVQLLHEANQRLHDINDELRGALEAKKSECSPVRNTTAVDVMKLSAVMADPSCDLSSSIRSTKSHGARSLTPTSPRHLSHETGESSFNHHINDNSLFSEIHRASTPYKSDLEEDEAYGTMANEKNNNVHKQIQILEDTNKRLSSSNDELRVALKLIARSGSLGKPRKMSTSRRSKSFTGSDYGSLSSRSSRSQSLKQKRSSGEVGEATDESTTYDSKDDEIVQRTSDSATMNPETVGAPGVGRYSEVKKSKSIDDGEDDDEDDEDLNSEDLAKLVAFASDITDNTASDSDSTDNETKYNTRSNSRGSKECEDTSTMTNDSLSQSSTPERMYKLVLAGDAAVGKSSFILRLCRNKFHSNLNATLGVDFQVKNIEVDSKTVALQLWDTAGQERFRSIAKSYFRKVDAVLLLYDVTNESSFVNIRDWMRTIEESSNRKVPIMLCANKCDLRDEFKEDGRFVISTENGEKLAESYGAMFIETSAKDGKHIADACKELARVLATLENEEIRHHGLKLDKQNREKKKKCCNS